MEDIESKKPLQMVTEISPVKDPERCSMTFNRTILKVTLAFTFVVFIFLLITSILVAMTARSDVEVKKRRTCLKCTVLSELIDRWAWKDIDEDESTGDCCFNGDLDLMKTLKYYFDIRLSGNVDDVDRLQQKVENLDHAVWDLVRNRTDNLTLPVLPSRDISRLIDLIQEVFHKERAVLHLTSRSTIIEDEPRIIWRDEVKQGNLTLHEDGHSVKVQNTGLYFISIQIKFRTVVARNQTRNTTIQFYLAKVKQGRMARVDDYKKSYVFHDKMVEYDATLHTISRLERGENLIIRFPTSQKQYLASEAGSHRFSIFELS